MLEILKKNTNNISTNKKNVSITSSDKHFPSPVRE